MMLTRAVSTRIAVSAGSAAGLMLIAGCGGHDMSQMSSNDSGNMSNSSAASQPNGANSADAAPGVTRLLEPLGIPVLPAHTFESLLDDPHLRDIGFFG